MLTYKKLGRNGALGNQLWEIAGTYGQARDAGTRCKFPRWFYEPYFSVPGQFFGRWLRGKDLGSDYLQDLAHWSPSHEDAVRAFFAPSDHSQEVLQRTYEGEDLGKYTAVHVRRGNNVTPEYATHHPVPTLDYFEDAVAEVGGPLMVFSDDLAWCREQAVFQGARFAMGPPADIDVMDLTKYGPLGTAEAAYDLLAMAQCGNHIISNSSFSWWSAWLAITDRVIYPRVWYGTPYAHLDTSLMFTGLDWEMRG